MSVGRHFHSGGVSWLSLIITTPGDAGRCADVGAGLAVLSTGNSPLTDRYLKEPDRVELRICTTLASSNLLRVIGEEACDCQIKPANLQRESMPCTVLHIQHCAPALYTSVLQIQVSPELRLRVTWQLRRHFPHLISGLKPSDFAC